MAALGFVDQVDNNKRLRSALGYQSVSEFEERARQMVKPRSDPARSRGFTPIGAQLRRNSTTKPPSSLRSETERRRARRQRAF